MRATVSELLLPLFFPVELPSSQLFFPVVPVKRAPDYREELQVRLKALLPLQLH